ncbi:fumarylacetoacetate hydrolase family protein [Catenovulum sediminis]|uniref:fumarylacetoacetate hydrolase family protein n=1 Tax=Catenovulum sediminis TaxID=1740262 RepID=UPI00117FFF2D|nr:fumarylacetoacetate hydrolase family protein [Catenovulum sediminis]
MQYFHQDSQGKSIDLPVGKVICIGGNYADHIKEMSSLVTDEPVLFMKPSTAMVRLEPEIKIPTEFGECHNETEIAVLIGTALKNADVTAAENAIWGIGIAQDLTLRALQKRLKSQGRPWERAKSFDASCPLSGFTSKQYFDDLNNIEFSLEVNGKLRQAGNSANMERSIVEVVSLMSQNFTLLPGDVVLTGTPAGVAALSSGDKLSISFDRFNYTSQVVTHD